MKHVPRASLVVLLLCAAAPAEWLSVETPSRPRALVYAAEFGAGLGAFTGAGLAASAAGVLGLMAVADGNGGLFGGRGPDPRLVGPGVLGMVIGIGGLVLTPAATGCAVSSVGNAMHEDGSRTWAIVGAYAGLPLAVGATALGLDVATSRYGERTSNWDIPFYVVAGLCIPAGAVVGYNLGIKREVPPSGFGGRLQPPAVAMTSMELPDHSFEYGVKVQLAGLRF